MAMSLKQSLDATRDGYREEGCWMRLLLDGYRGSGGFQGRAKQPPSGFWGAAAEAYSSFSLLSSDANNADSYLDRYPRETVQKFNRRRDIAHYANYIKPITNLKISYIVRKPHRRNNLPPALSKWIEQTGYDKGLRRRALVTAVLGWFPMCVDMPAKPSKALTAAQAGEMTPYTMLRLPSELVAYSVDDEGKFLWAKIKVCSMQQKSWDSECQRVERYTIWTRTDFTVLESVADGEPVLIAQGTHPFKAVPVVAWRTDANVDDPVKSDSINAELICEVRRLFNLVSELDETLRSNVFPLLIVPSTPTSDEGTGGGGEKQLGNENGITVGPEQKNLPQFIAPPATVAETYELRIERTIIEIYRMARVEYDKAAGVRSNAQSQEQNFQQTNLAIVDFAQSLANADRETLILVGRGMGIPETQLEAIECVAHDSYAEGTLNDEIDAVIQTMNLAIGNTAKGEILKRIVMRVLNGVSAKTRAIVESEIDDAVQKAEQEREAAAAAVIAPDPADNKKSTSAPDSEGADDTNDASASGGNA